MDGERLYKHINKMQIKYREKVFSDEKIKKIRINEKTIGKNHKKYVITDETSYENEDRCLFDYRRYFYNELKKDLNPLEIEYEDNSYLITNKKELRKKLNDSTFNYFSKYPFKGIETNTILNEVKKGLKYENIEQEMDEESVFPYLFRLNEIKDGIVESKSAEIYSGYNFPTVIHYNSEKIDETILKINFKELIDEEKLSLKTVKIAFRKEFGIPSNKEFEFDFLIEGYYMYNQELEIIEKIKVIKNIKFFESDLRTERILELIALNIEDMKKNRMREKLKKELFESLKLDKITKSEVEKKLQEILNTEISNEILYNEIKEYIMESSIDKLDFHNTIYISKESVLNFFKESLEIIE